MQQLRSAPLGFQSITDLSTAVGLTLPEGTEPDFAVISATGDAVCWRDDGVAPTADVGMPMLPTDPPFAYSGDLSQIRFISATGGIAVSYYKVAG